MSLATVYGQLHYGVDVLAGTGLAVAALTAGRRAGYDCSLTVPTERTPTHGEPR